MQRKASCASLAQKSPCVNVNEYLSHVTANISFGLSYHVHDSLGRGGLFLGDHYTGHAQASMVTEQYAHILDDDRRLNAQRFDDFFYRHQGAEPEMPHQTAQPIPENSAVDADAAAALTKLLANPSMAELIKNLAKNL